MFIQDEEGHYSKSIPAAESFEAMQLGKQITVKNLIPGRRFRIELEPKDQIGNRFNDERKELKAIFEVGI